MTKAITDALCQLCAGINDNTQGGAVEDQLLLSSRKDVETSLLPAEVLLSKSKVEN